jgi:hypothetical protein
MKNVIVCDEKYKRKMGIICCIPIISFLIVFLYFSILLWPLTYHHELYGVEGIISRNYDVLFTLLASAAIITAPVFIYCLVVLARLKSLDAGQKIIWIVVLSIMAPVASFFFWLILIRHQPRYTEVYPNIA